MVYCEGRFIYDIGGRGARDWSNRNRKLCICESNPMEGNDRQMCCWWEAVGSANAVRQCRGDGEYNSILWFGLGLYVT